MRWELSHFFAFLAGCLFILSAIFLFYGKPSGVVYLVATAVCLIVSYLNVETGE